MQVTLLNVELLLLLDQRLEHLEIRELRTQLLVHQRLADVDALLDDRNCRLEFSDGSYGCRSLGFSLFFLTIERGDLGAMLDHLVDEKLALSCDQHRRRPGRGYEVGRRIIAVGERSAQTRD